MKTPHPPDEHTEDATNSAPRPRRRAKTKVSEPLDLRKVAEECDRIAAAERARWTPTGPLPPYVTPPPRPRPVHPPMPAPHRKRGYHHGNLREAAIRHARELVTRSGPRAITLRGVAKALGVTAPALVYHFGNLDGLRAAVSASFLEDAAVHAGVSAMKTPGRPDPKTAAPRWVAFAGDNPYLYRLAAGECWHDAYNPTGIQGWYQPVPTPRRMLEFAFRAATRRKAHPKGDLEKARDLAVLVHGLALARVEGLPEADVARALARVLAA